MDEETRRVMNGEPSSIFEDDAVFIEKGDGCSSAPVIAFINVNSGNNTVGREVIKLLKQLPFVLQVYDNDSDADSTAPQGPPPRHLANPDASPKDPSASTLTTCGPPAFAGFTPRRSNKMEEVCCHQNVRVVVGGGDGSVGWIMQMLEGLGKTYPVAPIPLGTGNDLARALGWGGGCTVDQFLNLICKVPSARPVLLDRWRVTVTHLSGALPARRVRRAMLPTATVLPSQPDPDPDPHPPVINRVFNNVFSIGYDAQVTLNMQNLRHRWPRLYKNRLLVKFWYAVFGAPEVIKYGGVSPYLQLEVDGRAVALPWNTGMLICSNIPSYCCGLNLWSDPHSDPQAAQAQAQGSAMDDGLVEVVALAGILHLGMAQLKWWPPMRLAQGRDIRITFAGSAPLAMQTDGEAWQQAPNCQVRITHHSQAPMLAPQEPIGAVGEPSPSP